jgi:hypothetical protein
MVWGMWPEVDERGIVVVKPLAAFMALTRRL